MHRAERDVGGIRLELARIYRSTSPAVSRVTESSMQIGEQAER
jgi:hypothetical protein